ncbi:putative sugar phosphate/phosphate translocator [Camellia lanceoleosa]|uniref:Sugar phosphate/phosphate translocator n=1 Tax=Camellia lanceoleosa TaxID=1840588 RepID=A0ACC0GYN2_9ERIC|nr:putative sugar phosphate/phosphate translocator [Camellia lanceoleosa]
MKALRISIHSSTKKHPAKRSVENNSDDKVGGDRTSPSAGEDHTRDVKRQKKLKYGLFDMVVKINGCTQPNAAVSKLESKFGNLSSAKAPTISDLCNANRNNWAYVALRQWKGGCRRCSNKPQNWAYALKAKEAQKKAKQVDDEPGRLLEEREGGDGLGEKSDLQD